MLLCQLVQDPLRIQDVLHEEMRRQSFDPVVWNIEDPSADRARDSVTWLLVGKGLLQTAEAERMETRKEFGLREHFVADGTLRQIVDAFHEQRSFSN